MFFLRTNPSLKSGAFSDSSTSTNVPGMVTWYVRSWRRGKTHVDWMGRGEGGEGRGH